MNGFGLLQVLSDLGTGGLMILVVVVFLKFWRAERAEHAKDRAEHAKDRTEFVSIITNHLKEDQESRTALTILLHELKTTIVALVARLNHGR